MNDKYTISHRTEVDTIRKVNRARFAALIADRFNLEELDSIIFELPLDKDNIPGNTKQAKAEALVEKCANRGKLQKLWEICLRDRPGAKWEELLEPFTPSEKAKKHTWGPLLAGVVLVLALIAIAVLLARPWLEGASALETMAVPVNLSPRANPTDKQGTRELILNSGQLQDGNVAVLPVYAPPGAPPELAAALFVAVGEGDNEKWLDSTAVLLPQGNWTTLVLPLRQIPPSARIGLQLSLAAGAESKYQGTLYIGALELLSPLESVALDEPPIKTPDVAIYSFEECVRELADWELVVPADGTPECATEHAFNGQKALAIDVSLQQRPDYETTEGTMQLELRDSINTDQLIVLRLYLPENAPENITAGLFLFDSSSVWRDGHLVNPLPPGKWTTLVWPTKGVTWSAPARVGLLLAIEPDTGTSDTYSGPVYIDLVELYTMPDYHTDPSIHDVPDDSFVDSFEEPDAYQKWITHTHGLAPAKLSLSNVLAFDGRYSLEVQTTLQIVTETNKTTQLVLTDGPDLHDTVTIFRVYVPQDAPTNIAAQLFLVDDEGQSAWGTFNRLTPGTWTTLTWNTQEASRTWESSTTPGIELKLQPLNTETDLSKYEGSLYIDLVEILPLPENDINAQRLDSVLESILFFDFEDGFIELDQIQLAEFAQEEGFATQQSIESLDGQKVLRLDVDVPQYELASIERSAGGIRIDLENIERVDAITTSIFVPEGGDGTPGDLRAVFVASDDKGEWHYSGFTPLKLGAWTPVFWGTEFAVSADEWIAWEDPQVQYFFIHVVSFDESGYRGSVYIDNIGLHRVSGTE